MQRSNPILFSSFLTAAVAAFGMLMFWDAPAADAGQTVSPSSAKYQALAPITHENLTIFPLIAANTHDTHSFLTLDEGLRSGEVVVTEAGGASPMIRRRNQPYLHHDGAEVNKLVLVNNSKRPLLLLAGEIVTGGKQDRVVGKDRIVPAESDADLSVFCVEPGRWTETSHDFGGMGTQMLQPSVRSKAMADQNQTKVWEGVRESQRAMAQAAPGAAETIEVTSSYATVMQNPNVQEQVDKLAKPIMRSYESVLRELKARNAVGVVVAVNGRIIWADMFASPALLEKYWPKLARSYAAEAVTASHERGAVTQKEAQAFVDDLDGTREVAESEPGVFRHTEISGRGYKVFELTSLLPGTGFDVHLSKMAE